MHTLLDHEGRPGTGRPTAAQPGRPRADCTADSAGGLTFDVTAQDGRDGWGTALLLRRRGGLRAEGRVRLPLVPAGRGRLRAALPSTMRLAEGRWDAFLELPGAEPRRLRPGRSDLGPLVARVPGVHRTWLGVRIPYATPQENLTVRSWLRWPHAEVGTVTASGHGIAVHGRLYGALVGRGARLEARPRGRSAAPVSAPVYPSAGAADGFEGELSGELPAVPGLWQLWLRPSPTAEPVRLARLLDDVPDKRRLVPCPPFSAGGLSMAAAFTSSNDLAVRVLPE
jgi:hypothetical protein